jgi:hypothetical protein
MPTHDEFEQFLHEFHALSRERQRLFLKAVAKMIADLKAGKPFRKSLRISVLGGYTNIYEMT